jgi:hypothetical protein
MDKHPPLHVGYPCDLLLPLHHAHYDHNAEWEDKVLHGANRLHGARLAGPGRCPAVPPSFNVALHAKSTYDWFKFCSSGQPPMMEVIYSGVTIAKMDIKPFCIDVKGEKVIVATTMSPGWSPLPKVFHERMESDRHHGGVHMEVDFIYNNEDHTSVERTWWVRCRTTLDVHKPFPCSSYIVQGYFED